MTQERQPRRRSEGRFSQQPTELPYVNLRTEPGMEIEISRSTLFKLLELAVGHYQAKIQKAKSEEDLASKRDEIASIAQQHLGLRGLISETDNVILTVFPQEREVDYNEELLRLGLGHFFDDIVRKRFTAEVPDRLSTPVGVVSSEKITQVIMKAIAETFQIPEEEVANILKLKPKVEVDEKRLGELISNGQATLPEDARIVGKIVWEATTDKLN